MCLAIDKFAEDLKQKLKESNDCLLSHAEKFTSCYEKLKGSNPLLSLSLHRLGWTFGGYIANQKEVTCVMAGEYQYKQKLWEEEKVQSHEVKLKQLKESQPNQQT